MSDKPKIIKKQPDNKPKLYYAFRNAKSVCADLAREIVKSGENIPPDVRQFVEFLDKKAA